jgi:hypothetical protein
MREEAIALIEVEMPPVLNVEEEQDVADDTGSY